MRTTDDGLCCGFNPVEIGWNSETKNQLVAINILFESRRIIYII